MPPASNKLYPVTHRTELRTGFGEVPEYTTRQLTDALRMARAEGDEGAPRRLVAEVARLAPAFSPELVEVMLAAAPEEALCALDRDALDEASAATYERYAAMMLARAPTLMQSEPAGREEWLDGLARAVRTMERLAARGHAFEEDTPQRLLHAMRDEGGEGEEAPMRAMFERTIEAVLAMGESLTARQWWTLHERVSPSASARLWRRLATHPVAPEEGQRACLEARPRVVGRALARRGVDPDDRPDLRRALRAIPDAEVAMSLLKEGRPEEFTPLIRNLAEADPERVFEVLDRPRFAAMARSHLKPSALGPLLKHEESTMRQRAMVRLGELGAIEREASSLEEMCEAALDEHVPGL